MTASAILSAPTPLAGAVNQPPAEAGTVLPAAAAAFGALVDATTAPSAQPTAATPRIDLSITTAVAPGAIAPTGMEPGAMPGTSELPAPMPEVAGDLPLLPPTLGDEGQPAAPVPGKPSAHPAEPATDVDAAPSEPVQPAIVQPALPAQLQSPVMADTQAEPTSPLKEDADPAASEADGGEVAAQPAVAAPQSPVPPINVAQPTAQTVPTASRQADADASEAVPDITRAKASKQSHATGTMPVSGGKEMSAADAARPAAQGVATASVASDVPATADQPDTGLPSPLLTQTMAPVTSRPAAMPYPPAAQASAQAPVVAAQPGRMGADIGVEIAKAAKGDREDLLIRLDPRDLGRINVRLSFDSDGVMRAVMSADSPAALDMLRRESGDLNRALADAGIRSDAQSLRFDARSSDQGQGGNQSGQRGQQAQHGGSQGSTGDGSADLADVHYRPLRSSGQVDLMA